MEEKSIDSVEENVNENEQIINEAELQTDKAEENVSAVGDSKTKKTDKIKSELKQIRSENTDLKKRLEDCEAKFAESNDKYLRIAAEYDNYRKRTQKERDSIYADAAADTVMGLIPLIDNLMYAEKCGASGSDSEKFIEGVQLILSKVPETLEKMNISAFGVQGETFDPNIHNAVMHIDDESYGEGEIVDVLQCGYKYGEKIIRYAMVKVAN